MKYPLLTIVLAAVIAAIPVRNPARAADEKPPAPTSKVYGEWRIRPRPDKGAEYRRLIEQKGLPLFREGGGRMVGWWTTLIGDLYEHVTVWEYDDMAAYQKAVERLGKDERFAQFAAARDPLLTGEESRFLKLAPFAEKPRLDEPALFVIHEVHRVPLRRLDAYLKFMEKDGLGLLKKHGFRPVGPWLVAVGKWTEVTYLFRFDSLAERDRLIADFSAHPDGAAYGKVMEYLDEISTRLLVPAPFAAPAPAPSPRRSSLLPHLEEVAPGVNVAGFADRYRSVNCGWVALRDEALLIDLPRGVPAAAFLAEVARLSGKPARRLVLTGLQPEDVPLVEALLEAGVRQVLTSAEVGTGLLAASKKVAAAQVKPVAAKTAVGDDTLEVDLMPQGGGIVKPGSAVVHLPGQRVLFAGPLVVHGSRVMLKGTDTGLWLAALRRLEELGAAQVVPGRGSWGGPAVLARQRRFLAELRRQVGYVIAQGRTCETLTDEVRLPDDCLVWRPYDTPTAEDLLDVFQELTVEAAPFNDHPPTKSDRRPHALVLLGDQPHEPGHIEEGLRPVFEATGVVPHFAVDVRALSAENLARVQLLVICRDGLQRPKGGANYVWMTPEQEQEVVAFVERGGAFLNLHNALGLYPEGGPYLKLAGGRYTGHGPLERFRVEVVDRDHPITRGVENFSVADEQHTPVPDLEKVHLLLRSRSDDGKMAAAGWAYEPGRGRVCHLAPGHTREALLHPMYQRLLGNAVDWCLRRQAGSDGK
jgi:type 1 glutamine amidotransferase/glyoxylase-like metal-dependent hydrolase (beta-lactamase superfamily II)